MAKLFKLPAAPKGEDGKESGKAPYSLKGEVKVAGKVFKDGQLLVSDEDGALLAPILTRFHGCTVETIVEQATAEAAAEGSLAATETKK